METSVQQDATAKTAEMLRDEAAWHQRRLQAYESLYLPRKPAREVAENDLPALYDVAAGVIGNVPLLYLEFGVFQGRSIGRMAERFPHPAARFVGFDSFEGLPEDWCCRGTRRRAARSRLRTRRRRSPTAASAS
jgi:hypothetical protein